MKPLPTPSPSRGREYLSPLLPERGLGRGSLNEAPSLHPPPVGGGNTFPLPVRGGVGEGLTPMKPLIIELLLELRG
jgi:hypothetical protein